jgi:protein-lysine N-methyltransferase EEF2KMT
MTSGTDLGYLLRAYAALLPPKHLCFPQECSFEVAQDFFVNKILFDPHLSAYPPASAYQHSFWKWVIPQLENLMDKTNEAGYSKSYLWYP